MADKEFITKLAARTAIENYACRDCEHSDGKKCDDCEYQDCINIINEIVIKRGKWRKSDDELFLTCSECKEDLLYNTITRVTVWSENKGLPSFCPCCGADMRGTENG